MEGPEINFRYKREVKIQQISEKRGLGHGSISFLYKGPDNKYFRLYKPYTISATFFIYIYIYICVYIYVLGWPKSSFGFLVPCYSQTWTKFLANPVYIYTFFLKCKNHSYLTYRYTRRTQGIQKQAKSQTWPKVHCFLYKQK